MPRRPPNTPRASGPNIGLPTFPVVTIRTGDGEVRTASSAHWVLLEAGSATFDADPPPRPEEAVLREAAAREGKSSVYGPKRLGRINKDVADGWTVPGPWPPWQEAGDSDPHIEPVRPGFSMIDPPEWSPSDFGAAYARAWRIMRRTKLRHGAAAAVLYCQGPGRWWALHIAPGEVVVRGLEDPRCRLIHLRRVQSERRFGRRPPSGPDPGELTDAFLADFGKVGGAIHWAFHVAHLGRERIEAMRQGRKDARFRRLLAERPEWAALRLALEREYPHGGGLREVFGRLEQILLNGPGAAAISGYVLGFEAGATLARLQAVRAVAASEDERAKGKPELRAALREIINAIQGDIRPYVIAAQLLGERGVTERGRRLAQFGLPATVNRIGALITEEAEALGIYQRGRPDP